MHIRIWKALSLCSNLFLVPFQYLRDPKAIEERLRYHERRVTLREQMEVPDSNTRDVTAC